MLSRYIKSLLMILILSISCKPGGGGISVRNSPHEKYRRSLEKSGLGNTKLVQAWQAAADKSLGNPTAIDIPYKETGYFEMEIPGAAGYLFSAKRGEKLHVAIVTKPVAGFHLFVELWEKELNEKPNLLSVADTITKKIEYEVKKDGQFIVRIQPELLQGAAYTITITTGPSLAFPVNKKDEPRIMSLWGVERDAGARSHEGIDIQARKLTPAIAAADGRITRVTENNLGGKVVFLRPKGQNYNLYYAHLDQQLVRDGESVNAGDTIGLIGNTGNARTTPAHLHFGIYASGGAIDPFPFVNFNRSPEKEVKADTSHLSDYVRVTTNTALRFEPSNVSKLITELPAGCFMKVLAAADDFFKIRLPDGREGYVNRSFITDEPISQKTFADSLTLFDMPHADAAVKMIIGPGPVSILGTWEKFYFVKWKGSEGWIEK
jgi:peptidoglycan LD-endopeptidase LytH